MMRRWHIHPADDLIPPGSLEGERAACRRVGRTLLEAAADFSINWTPAERLEAARVGLEILRQGALSDAESVTRWLH
jgi:hypothetical protein